MNFKIPTVFLLFTILLCACGFTGSTSEPGLPKSWITFESNKYVYQSNHTAEEMKKIELAPTGKFTGEDDGTKEGLEIFKGPESATIYVQDKSEGTRPWLKFTIKTGE